MPNELDHLPLLTKEDVAALLKVQPRTINEWQRQGRFPAPVRLGRLRRWRRSDLDQFIIEQTERRPDADVPG
jgi:excisionase family DNA binding protein